MTPPSNKNSNNFTNLANPKFDHKELEDDDCGLPESPIYSNYAKYLWKRAIKNGLVQLPDKAPKNTDLPIKVE